MRRYEYDPIVENAAIFLLIVSGFLAFLYGARQ